MIKLNYAGGPLLLGVALLFLLLDISFGAALPLDRIQLIGNLPLEESEAYELIGLEPGDPLEPDKIQAASERLRKACRDAYHPMVKIEWEVMPNQSGEAGRLTVKVEAGPKGRLQELRFTGAQAFSQEQLMQVVTTIPREGNWNRLLRKDRLKLEALKRDRAAIVELYHQHGYAEVDVGSSILEKPSELEGFRLTWPILKEGPVYKIGAISFRTESLPKNDVLEQLIPFKPGDVYDSRKIRSSRKNIDEFLYNNGYAFSSAQVELERKQGRVNVEFVLEVGKKPRLKNIVIQGNTTTKDHVILREITVRPGSLFDAWELKESQAGLDVLPMFSRAVLELDGDLDSEEYDLLVTVKEKLTGRLEAGVSYGEAEEGAIQVNISDSNLSLRPPFRGDGLEGRLSGTLGSSITRLGAELSNPRVNDSHWSLDSIVYAQDSEYVSEDYSEKSLNAQIVAGYPVVRGQLATVGLSATWYSLYDINELVEEQIDPDEEEIRLISLLTSWAMDYTDRWVRPTQGARLRVGLGVGSEALGSDTEVIQLNVKTACFYTPYRDHVLSLRAEFDAVQPYGSTEEAPLSLRTFLGGTRNLRGFDYRSVSPTGEEGVLLGGESSWWASVEYMFPVLSKLDLAFYYDIGDVSEEAFSVSGIGPVSNVGVGFLVRADNFPVRFDVAAPLQVIEEDTINEEGDIHISFSAGYRFY